MMMRRSYLFWVAAIAGNLSLASIAQAAAPSASQLAHARGLFAQAARHEKAGHWQMALKELKQVVKIKETAGVRYHMAVCFEHQKMFVEALNNYVRANDLASDGSAPDVAQIVLGKINHLRAQLVMVTVKGTLSGDHEIVVRVDEAPALLRIELGKPFAVTPALHRLVLQVDGRVRLDRFVDEKAGSQVTLALKAAEHKRAPVSPTRGAARQHEAPSSTSMEVSEKRVDSGGHPVLGWSLIGGGLALAAGGALAYGKAGAVADDSAGACLQAVSCDERRAQVVRQWDSAAIGLWAGAVVSAGVGLTFLLIGGGDDDGPGEEATSLVVQPRSVAVRTTF